MLQSDLTLRNFEGISSWIKNNSPSPFEFLSNLYETPYSFKINCVEGNESSSFVSENKIISRFLLMRSSKNSNLFLIELMLKCPTLSLLEEDSFISFRPILGPLTPLREVCCLSLWISESIETSSETSAYFFILDLASLYYWIDELEEISRNKL